MHERYITYGVVTAIAWAFAAKSRAATMSAVVLCVALFLQMLANWPLDFGWKLDTMMIALTLAPHAKYFAVYVTLNVIGLGLLILSRLSVAARQHPPAVLDSSPHPAQIR